MRLIVALLVSAALLMGACSKDARKGERGTTTIRLAAVSNPDFSLILVALAEGYFAEEGLMVKVKTFAVGKAALAELIKGEADLATALETPVMFAILGGERLSVAAAIGTSDRNMAIAASVKAGIARPEDLRGKAIGLTRGTAAEYFLNSFLVALKIGDSSVRLVDTPPGDLVGDLKAGKVDAAVLWSPLILQARAALGERGTVLYGENVYTANNCLVGDQAFLRKNPEAIKGVVRALLRAEDLLGKNPERALPDIAAATGIEVASLRPMISLFRFRVTLDQSLVLVLEDESRWARSKNLGGKAAMPNFLDNIYPDALIAVAPERVRLIR
jgi:ABC-type nitrate/sulfonate/bicarbonate transport system substrate-binding protein